MPNAYGRSIDFTDLSIDNALARGFLHRDYIAHCFRWSHVIKYLTPILVKGTPIGIFDIGCGCDLPLARALYSMKLKPREYVGVDWNRQDKIQTKFFDTASKFICSAYGRVDFAKDVTICRDDDDERPMIYIEANGIRAGHELPNIFTCFEMLEHVEPEHTRRVLLKLKSFMDTCNEVNKIPTAAFISTPCFDGSAADNHVNEMTRDALGALLEDLGFYIVANFGTFASMKDYKNKMLAERPELAQLWEELHGYYDTNVLATIFAPVFPQYSRNNLWVLRTDGQPIRRFPNLMDVKHPWSSSLTYKDLAG